MNINTQPLTNRVQHVLTNLYRQLPTFSMTQIMMFAMIVILILLIISFIQSRLSLRKSECTALKKYIPIFRPSRRFPRNITNIHCEIIILKPHTIAVLPEI